MSVEHSKTTLLIAGLLGLVLLGAGLGGPWVKGAYDAQQRRAVAARAAAEQRAQEAVKDEQAMAKFCQTYWLWEDKTGQRESKMVDLCQGIPGGAR